MKRILALLCVTVLLFTAMIPLFVSATELLKTDKTEYTVGEPIMVTATGEGKDWVGIYKKGEKPGATSNGGIPSIYWYYVAKNGNTSGTAKNIYDAEEKPSERADMRPLPAGEYVIFLLENDGYNVLAQVDITINAGNGGTENDPPASGKTLSTDKNVYTEGEPIMITATGEGKDWVGIYKKGEGLNPSAGGVNSIRWYYVARDGFSSGDTVNIFDEKVTVNNRPGLTSLPAGEYTIYLLENDGYNVLAQVDIIVNEDEAAKVVPAAPSKVVYDRTGKFVGAADGKLTITAGDENALPESYKVYWGDKNGPLADYTAFAPIKCTGKVTEYQMAANTLIPTSADRILVYAVRKNNISESAASVMLPEGCNDYNFGDPLYEMQILSDIHLNSSNSHIHNKHFAAALEDIKKLSPGSIGIFINGDIADHGEVSEYKIFQQLIKNAGSGLPNVYCAIGNHDLANGPYDTHLANFLKYTQPGTDQVYYDMWLNGVHFIFLGSEAPGLNAELSTKQLRWFKEKLEEDRDENRPTYVFLHQGLIDTVAGTFAYQKWHGINQSNQFAKILKDFPEVILFTGHSHWEMDSFQTMRERDDKLPTIFNTAAGGYLWNDDCMATNVGIEGSQGYYLYSYEDKVLMLGRDFVTGQWIASAQFIVNYPQSKTDEPGENISNENSTPTGENSEKDKNTSNNAAVIGGTAAGAVLLLSAAFTSAIIISRRRRKG